MKDLTEREPEENNESGPERIADRRGQGKAAREEKGIPEAFGRLAFLALAVSAAFFALYMAGSTYAPGVSDSTLFALLLGLRVAAGLLSAVSLVALGFSVNRLVCAPSFRGALRLCAYFFLALLGAVLAIFSLLIVAISAGN